MTGDEARIIFVVGNQTQVDNARSVARHLRAFSVTFFDTWSSKILDEPRSGLGHVAPVTLGRVLGILKARFHEGDVVILPQDVGMLQRVVAQRVRRKGGVLVLMPDGIVFDSGSGNGSRQRRLMRSVVDRALILMGLVSGVAGRMGSSRPDLILNWGPGWDGVFDTRGETPIAGVGCPRMDDYAGITGPQGHKRILVCSQPLHIPLWSQGWADEWYEFLGKISRHLSEDVEFRIRLHPAELHSDAVPTAIRGIASRRSLAEDIAWATTLASPFSSVTVDALAAGRLPILLLPDDEFTAHVIACPLFADRRVPRSRWDVSDMLSAVQDDGATKGLTSEFIANVGSASSDAAQVLAALVTRHE